MDKINLLHVCNRLDLGGTEKALQLIVENLDRSIFNIYVCGLLQGGIRERALREKGFEVYVINNDQEQLYNLMKEKKIQIVHFHRAGSENTFVILSANRANVPIIIETNVFGIVDDSPTEKLIDHHLFVSKMCALRYKHQTGLTDEEFIKHCKVLYNPVNVTDFEKHVSDSQILKIKENLEINKNDHIIGRISRPQRYSIDLTDFWLDMMDNLIKKIPHVKYIIVGAPTALMERIKVHDKEKNIIFLNSFDPDEVMQFYCLIDVFAHTSKIGESFGYTIAESMAAKKPVVVNSTPLANNAQIELIDNNKTGFVANTPETYAEAIGCLLINKTKAKKMGEAGYIKIKREYSVKRTAAMLQKIYITLLKEKNIKVDKKLVKKYDQIEHYPSMDDIHSFEQEYENRLLDCYGGLDPIYRFEVFIQKYFIKRILLIQAIEMTIDIARVTIRRGIYQGLMRIIYFTKLLVQRIVVIRPKRKR